MCDSYGRWTDNKRDVKTIPVTEAVGMVLMHDITEIRKDTFKGRAFRKGHVVRKEDICHLQRLGKEHLFVLNVGSDDMHEDDAAYTLATALMGEGAAIEGEPKEGKINIVAVRDGLLKVNKNALLRFNMLGEVTCATLHDNTVVQKGQVIAGTRAIPLVIEKKIVEEAVAISEDTGAIIEVKALKKPRAGVVITGNEVYYGTIQDAFAPIIRKKIEVFGGEIIGMYYAPDDTDYIEQRLKELIDAGADLLITTGGMSVDPDDVTRFAIRKLGAMDITYGSAVLPGAMFLIGYLEDLHRTKNIVHEDPAGALCTLPSAPIPILGIPACGMYHKTTVFDLILPRVLTGEKIGRRELAELGHGGLCMNCKECRYPICPFAK